MSNLALRPTLGPVFSEDEDGESPVWGHRHTPVERPAIRALAWCTALLTLFAFVLGALLAAGRDPLFSAAALNEGFTGSEGVSGITVTHRIIGAGAVTCSLLVCSFLMFRESRGWVRVLSLLTCVSGAVQMLTPEHLSQLASGAAVGLGLSLLHPLGAHLFLAMTFLLAYALSREVISREGSVSNLQPASLYAASGWFFALAFLQVLSGSLVRLSDASLAVPDFPFMGGGVLPPLGEGGMYAVNELRAELGLRPTSRALVVMHLAHRAGGFFIAISGMLLAGYILQAVEYRHSRAKRSARLLLVITLLQLAFGALLLWTLLDPIVLVLHMFLSGALITAALLLCARLRFSV